MAKQKSNQKTSPPENMDWGTARDIRNQLFIIIGVAIVWFILLVVLITGQEAPAQIEVSSAEVITWEDDINPLFAEHCIVCHGDRSGLSLETYEDTMEGGDHGASIDPGNGAGSILIQVLRGTHPDIALMPLNRVPFPEEVIARVAAWIDAGAPKTAADFVPTIAPTETPTHQPDEPPPPTNTPVPTDTPIPTNTALPEQPSAEIGAELWSQLGCQNCHGDDAEGGFGPKLAGTALDFDAALAIVRAGVGDMPAFAADKISDLEMQHLHAWWLSTAPPSPTPTLAPTDTPVPTATLVPPTPEAAAATAPTSTPTSPPLPTPTETSELTLTPLPQNPDAEIGADLWANSRCAGCHGSAAEGDFGSRLANIELSFNGMLTVVRQGQGDMPAFAEESISELELQHIYAWLESLASEPTATPTTVPEPTKTPLPEAPSAAIGVAIWPDLPCARCHGDAAQGDIGPKIAGTGLSLDAVLLAVRAGKAPMPAFTQGEVSDLEIEHAYAWLRSLAEPTPSPVTRLPYSIGNLIAYYSSVSEVKVRSDFAKDLPERFAPGDPAGQLEVKCSNNMPPKR